MFTKTSKMLLVWELQFQISFSSEVTTSMSLSWSSENAPKESTQMPLSMDRPSCPRAQEEPRSARSGRSSLQSRSGENFTQPVSLCPMAPTNNLVLNWRLMKSTFQRSPSMTTSSSSRTVRRMDSTSMNIRTTKLAFSERTTRRTRKQREAPATSPNQPRKPREDVSFF